MMCFPKDHEAGPDYCFHDTLRSFPDPLHSHDTFDSLHQPHRQCNHHHGRFGIVACPMLHCAPRFHEMHPKPYRPSLQGEHQHGFPSAVADPSSVLHIRRGLQREQ
jgi:hypothetical protein